MLFVDRLALSRATRNVVAWISLGVASSAACGAETGLDQRIVAQADAATSDAGLPDANACAGVSCGAGLRCDRGACVCDSTTCGGCCAGDQCVTAITEPTCGAGGAACVACDEGDLCRAGACKRGKIVLFGGWDTTDLKRDTWVWDGNGWTEMRVPGPSARAGAGMASLHGDVLLFGGNAGAEYGDTWRWDGAAWKQLDVKGPSHRVGHAMTTVGEKIVVYGGYDGVKNVDDTWQWDGRAWSEIRVPGPGARSFPAVAVLGDKVVLFGGYDEANAKHLNDTWEFDGKAWTRRDVTAPTVREATAATLRGRLVLFGRDTDLPAARANTWTWDGTAWHQLPNPGPSGRIEQQTATYRGSIILFGGQDVDPGGGDLGDTWRSDGYTWSRVASTGPSPRRMPAMAAQ